MKQQADAACFKARPNVVVHKEPFVPKRENRSILGMLHITCLALGLWLNVLNLHHLTAGAASLWFCCFNSPPLLFYFPFSPTINFFLCSILSCLLALSEADTTRSVVGEGFQLSTERRAKERLEFERALKEKELLRAQMEERQAREQEEREKEEIARLRQEQVHWSNCNYEVLINV